MENHTLSNSQRFNHILAGSVLIVFTMLVNVAPLGWLALLPLVGTYPIFAGMFGYDPIIGVVVQFGKSIVHAFLHHAPKHSH